MSKYDLQNKGNDKFERTAFALFKKAKTSRDEIEKIVAAPHLFDSIEARIRAEKQSRRTPENFFSRATILFIWIKRQKAFAAAFFLLAAVCAAVIVITRNQTEPQIISQIILPENKKLVENEIEQTEDLPPNPKAAEIKVLPVKIKKRGETKANNSVTPALPKSFVPRREAKRNQIKKPPLTNDQSPQIFYSLATGGNSENDGEELQIVRAELTRSELFALGVNLPDENRIPKIKTDLLVSAGGVPRAIRFVE